MEERFCPGPTAITVYMSENTITYVMCSRSDYFLTKAKKRNWSSLIIRSKETVPTLECIILVCVNCDRCSSCPFCFQHKVSKYCAMKIRNCFPVLEPRTEGELPSASGSSGAYGQPQKGNTVDLCHANFHGRKCLRRFLTKKRNLKLLNI